MKKIMQSSSPGFVLFVLMTLGNELWLALWLEMLFHMIYMYNIIPGKQQNYPFMYVHFLCCGRKEKVKLTATHGMKNGISLRDEQDIFVDSYVYSADNWDETVRTFIFGMFSYTRHSICFWSYRRKFEESCVKEKSSFLVSFNLFLVILIETPWSLF